MTSGINSQEPIYMWRLEGDGWMECTKEWFEGDISSGYEKRIVYASPVQQSPAVAAPVFNVDLVSAILEDYADMQTSGFIPTANRYSASDAMEQVELLSTPTPPSAERKAFQRTINMVCYEPKFEQPDSAALNKPVLYQYRWYDNDPNTVTYGQWYDWNTCTKEKHDEGLDLIRRGFKYEVRALYTGYKPQRITEQDAREILASYSAYVGADAEIFIDAWLNTHEGKSLIAKASAPADSEVK